MKERNIALIGSRATGKSTVGKILARKLGRDFIDMDERLILEAGRDIAAWVEREGWDSFRTAESGLLKLISRQKKIVAATGGGIILDPQNRTLLRENFITVWLKASSQTIYSRLCSDPGSAETRPALTNLPVREEIDRVLSEREPLYAQAADFQVDTEGKKAAEVAKEIIKAVKREP